MWFLGTSILNIKPGSANSFRIFHKLSYNNIKFNSLFADLMV